MTAINKVVENNGDFIGAYRENVIKVIGGYPIKYIPTEYDEKIKLLQQEMLSLIEESTKQGDEGENFDYEYRSISEEINEIKESKLRLLQEEKQVDRYKKNLNEKDSTLRNVQPQMRFRESKQVTYFQLKNLSNN